MSWWSRTCEELGIITSPFPLFSSLLWCHYAPSSWSNDDWHVSEASFSAIFLSFCEFGRSSSLAVLLYLTCCHTITTTFSFLSAWSGNFNSWHIWASITVTSTPSSCWNKSDYDTWHIWTSTAATTAPFSCWFRVFSWPFWAFTSTKLSPSLLWFIDLFYFLYLLAYLKHTFLHLLEESVK